MANQSNWEILADNSNKKEARKINPLTLLSKSEAPLILGYYDLKEYLKNDICGIIFHYIKNPHVPIGTLPLCTPKLWKFVSL